MDEENFKIMFNSMWEREGNNFTQFLLNAGLEVNALNKYGTTMLSHAAEYGNLEIIEFLVLNGADCNITNSDGSKPLYIAAQSGREDIVKFLLDKGAFVDNRDMDFATPLLLTARYSRLSIVENCFELGATVKYCPDRGWKLIQCAHVGIWVLLVKYIMTKVHDLNPTVVDKGKPLLVAACYSPLSIFECFVEYSADKTLLPTACENGWIDIVKYFVSKGYDFNAETSDGKIPLFLAASHSDLTVFEYLIESGISIECRNQNGLTLMHYACKKGWIDVVKSLLDRSYDVNAESFFVYTPLHYAILNRQIKIIECLLTAGKNAAYLRLDDYIEITKEPFLKQVILQDIELCARSVVNKYNNSYLPEIYEIPAIAERLPAIENMKIATTTNIAQDIANCVEYDIQKNGFCNVLNVHPIVLNSLCVRSISKFFSS